MLGVLSAERAILAAFKTIGSILLILDRVVVSLLALVTSQGDFDSVVSHTFRHLLYYLSALRSGHLPPCVEQEILSGAKICARKKTSRPTGTDKYTIVKTGGQVFFEVNRSRPPIVCQCALSVLSAFFCFAGHKARPHQNKAENPSKNTTYRCCTVLPDQIFVQAKPSLKELLSYLH